VAVLVSGEGTNLQALLDQVHGSDGIEVVAVAGSHPAARGLERARAAGVETAVFERAAEREERDRELADWLDAREVGLVVLAGWMELLSAPFVERFRGRILNVHPALLPAFPGLDAIEQALAYGVRVAGVTIHFVDEGTDTGPVLLQEAFELPYHRDLVAIRQHFHEVEHRLLPRAVRLIAAGRVRFDADNPRLVHIDGTD
jgi:phosphoribosylglycinamide formyltransferase-1